MNTTQIYTSAKGPPLGAETPVQSLHIGQAEDERGPALSLQALSVADAFSPGDTDMMRTLVLHLDQGISTWGGG